MVGGTTGATFNLVCPDGSLVAGFSGQAGQFVDQLALVCATPGGTRVSAPDTDCGHLPHSTST